MFFRKLIGKIHFFGTEPYKAHSNDAGWDLVADDSVTLESNTGALINTGFRVDIPAGYAGLVLPRSSISAQNILVFTGVIDSGYKGEVRINLYNLNRGPFVVDRGQRVAQLVIVPVCAASLSRVLSLGAFLQRLTDRGERGFGSTGR